MELFTEVISEIKEKVTTLKGQLSRVSTENEKMAKTIAVLEERLTQKQTELDDALHKIDELSADINSTVKNDDSNDHSFLQEDIEALVQEIDDCIIRLKIDK